MKPTFIFLFFLLSLSCNLSDEKIPASAVHDVGSAKDITELGSDSEEDFIEAQCNNGRLEIGEICDGLELGGSSCKTEGFDKGVLSCAPNCSFDTSDCSTCGDEILHENEICENGSFREQTCSSVLNQNAEGNLECVQCNEIASTNCRGPYKQIRVGAGVCGLTRDGEIDCWGYDPEFDVRIPSGTFQSFELYGLTGCGINDDGAVLCWGYNSELWQGMLRGSRFKQISLGASNICGVNTVGNIRCFGMNQDPYPPPIGLFDAVTSGQNGNSCALKANGEVECWGPNGAGETDVDPTERFSQIIAKSRAFCGLNLSKQIVCWGQIEPDPLPGTYESLNVNGLAVCGVRADGTFECNKEIPYRGTSFRKGKIVDIRLGQTSCARYEDGSIDCVGDNSFARAVVPGETFEDIVMSNRDFGGMCAIRGDQSVKCWNRSPPPNGKYKQVSLGDQDSVGIVLPEQTLVNWMNGGQGYFDSLPEGSFQQVSIGSQYGCAIKSETKEVICWGNDQGVSVPMGRFESVEAVSPGAACAIRENGEISCWGNQQNQPQMEYLQKLSSRDMGLGAGFNRMVNWYVGDGILKFSVRASISIFRWEEKILSKPFFAPSGKTTGISSAGRTGWDRIALLPVHLRKLWLPKNGFVGCAKIS